MREFLDFMNGEEPREDEMVCVSDLEFEAIGPGYIVLSVGKYLYPGSIFSVCL
jgi:hypothetical protein